MIKKIAVIIFCSMALSLVAQESKFGHVNSVEILSQMPEQTTIEKTINELNTQWDQEITKLRDEYYAKIKEYQEKLKTNMPESIKTARQGEIADLEKRITALQKTANTDLQKRQQDLFAPVIERVKKAIDEVGIENDYLYIFDLSTQSIIFKSPKSNDLTPLVKKKIVFK